MPPRLRPRFESLEARTLLSTVNALDTRLEDFNFVAPGTRTNGVHAVASQQASSVTLTLQRTAPGVAIQVEVATGPIPTPSTPVGSAQPEVPTTLWGQPGEQPTTSVPSAEPGVQYQPVVETITFPRGVTSEPVTIPIVAGAANPGMLSFEVTATQLGVNKPLYPGASGQATEDVFLAQTVNAPVPRIDGAHLVLSGGRVTGFVLHFSMPMDPASVLNGKAYFLQDNTFHGDKPDPGLSGLLGFTGTDSTTAVLLKGATYDPSTNTVDLHLANSVPAGDGYLIDQSLVPNTTLLDAAGTPINEDGSGLGGGFRITLTSKKVTIFDGVTQSVITATAPPRGARS